MHRYWLRVCTNLALSIYWIQKKNDAISVHAYHLLLNCLLEKTQIYRELNSLSHALCRAQPRSVCRLCPARQQELQPWQGRLRHQRSHGRPAERMLRRSLLMFILHTYQRRWRRSFGEEHLVKNALRTTMMDDGPAPVYNRHIGLGVQFH